MTLPPIFTSQSLLRKIAIKTAVTIIVLGALTTYFVYNQVHDLLLSQIYSDNQITAAIFADRTKQRIKISRAQITNLTNIPLIQNYYQTEKPTLQEKKVLERLTEENYEQNFSAIYLLDKNGNTLVSTEPTFVDQNYSFRPYFQNAIKGKENIDIAVGKTSKQLGFYLSSPVTINNQIIGVAVGKLKTEPILHLMDIESLKSTATNHTIHLLDETGTIIISTNKQFLLSPISDLTNHPELKKLSFERYNNQSLSPQEYKSTLEALLNHNHATIEQNQTLPSKNPKLLTLAPVPDTPFHVLLETELSSVAKSISQISQVISLIIFGAAVLAVFIINLTLYQKLKPLSELTQSALNVAEGKNDWEAPATSPDEIGQLSDAFTAMTKKLIDSKKSVETKVAQRTAELTKLNSFMVDRELKMIELKRLISQKRTSKSK